MLEPFPYVMATHTGSDYCEWGSAPRGPLVSLDMAHRGELMGCVVGDDPATGTPMAYQVLRCEMCIYTHVFPLPSEEALAAYYAQQFYAGPAAHEVAQHEQDRAYLETCVYGSIFDQCEGLLGRKPLNVLDIGSGSGIALDTAQHRGWRTRGIEPDVARCEALAAREHGMCIGTLAQHAACVKKHAPDIVVLWEMLEHLPCPEAFLLDLYDVIPPGALLVISCPNDYNVLQMDVCQQYHLKPWWLIPPVHLCYFTPKTLQLLVRRCGWSLRDLRTSFPMEMFMLEDGGQCYVGNSTLWRHARDRMIAIEMQAVRERRWEAQEALYRGNMQERIGRSILCIAQKPRSFSKARKRRM